jgi:thiol-disulfide isomerase/thioredoxin
MIGESPQVGRLAIPWKIVSELNVHNSFSRSLSDLVSWTLKSPPELPNFDSENAAAAPVSSLIGKPAPELELVTLDGKQTNLSDLRGQTVILDFWATWCGPCVVGLPQVMEVALENPDDVVLIAVNQQEDAATIETFLATHGWDGLTVALDEDGNAARRYGVSGIPHTVIVDPNGDVQHVHVGISPNLKATLTSEIGAFREAGDHGSTESK